MQKKIALLFFWSALVLISKGQTQRALIIGIDHYAPPAGYSPSVNVGRMLYSDLEGCLNDAHSIRSVLISRFGFLPENLDTLMDLAASREQMIASMHKLLLDSKAGDIAVIYYAGHGSLVRNSLSLKPSHLDESIVPADAWQEGIPDIRDKELSAIFNQFIDSGVDLTVIFDCCHSGSISRGPNLRTAGVRYVPISNFDVCDGSRPLTPDTRPGDHFMIFSACQADENAMESNDERLLRHGVFTLSLLKALDQHPATASARNIFYSARSILKSSSAPQEPVIGGSPIRQERTLFGRQASKIQAQTLVPLTKSDTSDNHFIMEGGIALGLSKGTTLACEKDTSIVLEIDSVLGMDRSLATMIRGKIADITPGQLFAVTNWVSSEDPLLTVYVPQTGVTKETALHFAVIARNLRRAKRTGWQPALDKGFSDPYQSVFWIGDSCYVKLDTGAARWLRRPNEEEIVRMGEKDSSIYMELPIAADLAKKISRRFATNSSIRITNTYAQADYVLFGILDDRGIPCYGLRKRLVSARDSLGSLPLMTDQFSASSPTIHFVDSIYDRAAKLAKIRGWINMRSPTADADRFPYNIYIYDEGKKQFVDSTYRVGARIRIGIKTSDDVSSKLSNDAYIYVFVIDHSGAMSLLFPGDDGNDVNHFPQAVDGQVLKDTVFLEGPVPLPVGTDNYFLLASATPISNATVIFNQKNIYSGIRKRGVKKNGPLTELLDLGNDASTRGKVITPFNWSLQKLSILCTR